MRRASGPCRFCRALDGAVMVEFSLMAPVLILLYLATVEASLAYMASRKVAAASAVAADLAAHGETIDSRTVGQVLTAARAALEPVDATALRQRVTSIAIDEDGVASVDWSVAVGIERLTPGGPVEVPVDLLLPGESVLMAETWLAYTSPLVLTLPGTQAMEHRYFVYPRLNDQVRWEGGS